MCKWTKWKRSQNKELCFVIRAEWTWMRAMWTQLFTPELSRDEALQEHNSKNKRLTSSLLCPQNQSPIEPTPLRNLPEPSWRWHCPRLLNQSLYRRLPLLQRWPWCPQSNQHLNLPLCLHQNPPRNPGFLPLLLYRLPNRKAWQPASSSTPMALMDPPHRWGLRVTVTTQQRMERQDRAAIWRSGRWLKWMIRRCLELSAGLDG